MWCLAHGNEAYGPGTTCALHATWPEARAASIRVVHDEDLTRLVAIHARGEPLHFRIIAWRQRHGGIAHRIPRAGAPSANVAPDQLIDDPVKVAEYAYPYRSMPPPDTGEPVFTRPCTLAAAERFTLTGAGPIV